MTAPWSKVLAQLEEKMRHPERLVRRRGVGQFGGLSARGAEDSTLMIHPGIQFGQVCCGDTRVPASVVAGCVFAGDSVDSTAESYELSRLMVLTACWWYVDRRSRTGRRTKADQRIVAAWGAWADEAQMILGHHKPGPCPDPPFTNA